MFFFGPYSWLILLVFAASLIIQGWLSRTYATYSKRPNAKALSGAEVARLLLDSEGLTRVRVEPVPGVLTDHYDPLKKAVRLSEPNFAERSVAALAVAAHETGHAIQDAKRYTWLVVRHQMLPAAQLGSNLGPWLFFIGLIIGAFGLAKIGLYLFTAAAIFHLVTLPVEIDASRRALRKLRELKLLEGAELAAARKVLTAAAFTYVAALAMSLAYLLQYAAILGSVREE